MTGRSHPFGCWRVEPNHRLREKTPTPGPPNLISKDRAATVSVSSTRSGVMTSLREGLETIESKSHAFE